MIQLSHAQMPFGKFKGRYLIDLPESYLVWFKQQGFPKGTLGKQLEAIYGDKSKWTRRINTNGSQTISFDIIMIIFRNVKE